MKKYLILGIIGLMLVFSFSAVLAAKPDFSLNNVVNPTTGEVKNTVQLPAQAVSLAPGLFYLGQAVDPASGKLVEGYAILRYKKGFGKPGTECGNGICEPGENAKKCPADCGGSQPPVEESNCYAFLSKDAKWKTLESYMVDAANESGLSSGFVKGNLANDINKWEAAANFNILGNEVAGVVDGADTVNPDNKNEVYFADIEEPGAIGITIVWGIFNGPPPFRELVEWDQVYDDVDYAWSDNGEAGKMDFENIATHELGHSVGMDDLYNLSCAEETMYGYADYGETNKRDLNAGDMTGVKKLYE